MSIFDKAIQQQMISALYVGRNTSHRVQFSAVVGHNGVIFEDIVVPEESLTRQDIDEEGNYVIISLINVSATACKSLEIDEETGHLVFDVAFGGKPFIGAVNPGLINSITTGDERTVMPIVSSYPYYLANEINKLVNDPDLMVVPVKTDEGTKTKAVKGNGAVLSVVGDAPDQDFDQDLPRPTQPFNPRIVH